MTDPTPVPSAPAGITPHLVVSDGPAAIAFYQRAFGATERYRMPTPDGRRLLHAEIEVNGGVVMLCDDFPEFCGGKRGDPTALGGSPVSLHLRVADADAVFARALEAGCTVAMPLEDQFWGDRFGKLRDPYGHEWTVGQTVRTPDPAEMRAAVAAMFPADG